MNEFLEQFLVEGRELVLQATDDLLALEEAPRDQSRLDGVFRGFHTLKGLAGIVEFAAMSRVLHAAESSLSAVRSGDRPITAEAITDYLACLDQVVQWLDRLEREDQLPVVPDGAVEALVALFDEPVMDAAPVAEAAPGTAQPGWVEALLTGHPDHRPAARVAIRYRPDRDCFFRGEDPLALIAALPGLLAVELHPTDPWPSLEELDPFACNLAVSALAAGTLDGVRACFPDAAGRLEIHPLDPPRPAPARVALSPEILAILECQLLLATENAGEGFAGRLGSAGQVSVNLLRHAGWAVESEAVHQAVAAGLRLGQAAPFTELLQKLIHQPPPGSGIAAVGSSRVDLQACKLEYSIVSPK